MPSMMMRPHKMPRHSGAIRFAVGSVMMPASAWNPRSTMASEPMPPISSSTTVAKTTSPESWTPSSSRISIAINIEATPPFMSTAPRPCTKSSCTTGVNGSFVQCSRGPGGTTSMCPVSKRERPPPAPWSRAPRLGRPSKVRPLLAPGRPSYLANRAGPSGSQRSVTKPIRSSRAMRYSWHCRSPGPASFGFGLTTEGKAMRSQSVATRRSAAPATADAMRSSMSIAVSPPLGGSRSTGRKPVDQQHHNEQDADDADLPGGAYVELQKTGLERDEQNDGGEHANNAPAAAENRDPAEHCRSERGQFEIGADIGPRASQPGQRNEGGGSGAGAADDVDERPRP